MPNTQASQPVEPWLYDTDPNGSSTAATYTWCTQRQHPFVTYNPQMDRTWCRCGQRQQAGGDEFDWEAAWEIFHDHGYDDPCRCYVSGGAA